MNESGLPSRIREFILRYVTSVEQLELLLLFAADPARSWTILQLVNELRSSQESVTRRMKQLLNEGFLSNTGEFYRFDPSPPEIAADIPELIATYREYRVRVTELIYSRAGVLKNFSDAFKLKPTE
ncbi:MAG TPA: hypothetical protein VHY30_10935 [Verrucomicrobiae bacterium]|jgi:predicted transcriptional regulator|nr:hypothetical protein [Verrucomicrobiae bacterium]